MQRVADAVEMGEIGYDKYVRGVNGGVAIAWSER